MILLTGSTGLVGSHLLYALLQQYPRVAALIRPGSGTGSVRETFLFYTKDPDPLLSRIEWRTGDLLDPASLTAALEGITCVINCAAVVSFDPKDRGLLVRSNVQGAANLVEAIRTREEDVRRETEDVRRETEDVRRETEDMRRETEDMRQETGDMRQETRPHRAVSRLTSHVSCLHISSISALGDGPGDSTKFLINEETPRDPNRKHTAYSDSKYLSERVILDSGIPTVVLNPGIILGPGQWNRGSSLLFRQAWEGMKYYPYGGVGYVDVRDVAEVVGRVVGDSRGGDGVPAFAGMTKEAFAGMTKEAFAGMTKEAFAGMTRLPDAVLPSYRLPVLKSSLIGQRFCLVGANLRYREFFNLVTDEFGLPNPTVYASRNTTEIAWRAEAVKAFVTRTRPRITREIAASSQRISYFSSDKIRQALGFDFRPIDETIEWVAAEFRRAESRPQ